ncbi:DNA cytosine methyltransferase [Arthrobacter sp. UYEF36]|uniref:DNA cytosine methyltransferase n=1 Tax=Arthrobacter sp. UYEF36 TaxID=1756366 RepID=UPI003397CE02
MADQGSKPIKTLSLFSGAGGLDIGFHQAGFEVVAAVEIEPQYALTLDRNGRADAYFGHDVRVHCEDIREFDPSPYVGIGIECVIGGPPCQTFSAAGRRSGGVLGLDDERGQLFRAYIRILDAIRPEVFVFENVYGLPGANGGGPWREIIEGFSSAGYDLSAQVVDAADYGTPQHRERLVMVGTKGSGFRFPMPTHGPDAPPTGLPLVSAQEALRGLGEPDEGYHAGPGGLYGHLLPLVPEGMNYSFFTREMGHPEPIFAWRSKFHDFLHKASPDEPVRTIKSKPGKFTGPFHWKNRHFTAAELKRLQSFPDEYEVVGSYNKVLEQIGNSVPPALARSIAISVKEQILRPAATLELPLRGDDFVSTFRKRQRERNKQFHEKAKAALGDRHGKTGAATAVDARNHETYFAVFDSPLDRSFHAQDPSVGLRSSVETQRVGSHLSILMKPVNTAPEHAAVDVTIELTGLVKYMDHTDKVTMQATVRSIADVVSVWVVIENELVKRSRFFTLIDIYGHYANRGDTVRVSTSVYGDHSPMAKLIEFFGSSENCGVAALTDVVQGDDRVVDIWTVDKLRDLRWDVRTKGTHPTLGRGEILCTYPFPSISLKAHFEKGQAGLGEAI